MYSIVNRLGYWGNVSLYYMLFAFLVFAFNLFSNRNPIPLHAFFNNLATIFISAPLAALFAGFDAVGFAWITITGAVVSVLVSTLMYHISRLADPSSIMERGLPAWMEIAFTFFGFSSYPVMLLTTLRISASVPVLVVLLIFSVPVGITCATSFGRVVEMLIQHIGRWRDQEMIPALYTSELLKLVSILNEVFVQLRDSFSTLGTMGGEIKNSSEDLSSVSEQMNASLEEVSSTIQQISKGAQEQSSSITDIARSIDQLNNLTTSISSQVKMASVSSRRTTNTAKQGMNLSKSETMIAKEIFEHTKFIEEKMNELRDQATEIKKILVIIAGISEQTDLLALNAAIEAARVGEQGRGFAVVADEIRNLANETQRSSSIVETLISEINRTIQELNTMLSSERDKMTESKELAVQAEEQFVGIVKAVDLVTDMISRINDAAVDQANHTKTLVKQVEQIAQVAADTAAATEEVSASVEEQTASMEEFTSTAQVLASFAAKLNDLLANIKK